MKIALFTDTYPPEINGVATSCQSLRDILVAHGEDVLVVTTNAADNRFIDEPGYVRIPGPAMKRFYGYRFAGFYNARAMKILKAYAPDVIHIQTDWCVGLFGRLVAKTIGVPVVYTYHTMYEDYSYMVTRGHFDRLARNLLQQYARLIITHTDEIIAPSLKTKDYLRQIGIDSYVNIVPTGVDFSRFDPRGLDQARIQELKDRFHLLEADLVLVSLGRLGKEKAVDVVIEGFRLFLKAHPKIRSKMVIVGKGPYERELKKIVTDLGLAGQIIFTGPCPPKDAPYYYALGNVFASASLTETQGLTYMEAMAARLFVLARYDHNLLDVIKEGTTGHFFETPEEMARKLFLVHEAIRQRKTAMLDQALAGIERYGIERFYEAVKEVYERAIRKKW